MFRSVISWLKARAREASTYSGLGVLTLVVGQLAKIEEAPTVAEALQGVGQSVAAGTDPVTAALAAALGLAAVFTRDRS